MLKSKNRSFLIMSWKKALYFAVGSLVFLTSCISDDREPVPDVSKIEVEVPFRRFEQDIFKLDTNNISTSLERLEAEYPEFSEVFFGQILRSKDPSVAPEGHAEYVRGFLTHPAVRHLYDTCMILYSDMSDIQKEFRRAFQFYKHYFPQRPVPDVTTFISEYTVGAFIYGENSLAVGLDFFLGEGYSYQQYNPGNPVFSAYLTRTFNRDHLVGKTLQPLIEDLLGPPYGNRLIDFMIYNGKKLYLLDKLLPLAPDSVILEVTAEQVEWLQDNELQMWAHFLSENLLYSSDFQSIRKLVEYSPHSPGMPPEAPGRTANWVGWQIVRAYMKQFPETTMEDLIALRDPQALLDMSKYKPKR
jgi:hypothetical protein